MCRSKHDEPSINFGIKNSITKLHLVGISTESYYDARSHEYQIPNLYYSSYNLMPVPIFSINMCLIRIQQRKWKEAAGKKMFCSHFRHRLNDDRGKSLKHVDVH